MRALSRCLQKWQTEPQIGEELAEYSANLSYVWQNNKERRKENQITLCANMAGVS